MTSNENILLEHPPNSIFQTCKTYLRLKNFQKIGLNFFEILRKFLPFFSFLGIFKKYHFLEFFFQFSENL